METSLLQLVRTHGVGSVFAGLVLAALAMLSLILFSPKFSVQTDYLVSQDSVSGKDYYTLTRSSEYVSKILAEVVESDRFIEEVVNTGKFEANVLPIDNRERIKAWGRMVTVGKDVDLGIIRITVSGDRLLETQKVSAAISEVFTEKNGSFISSDDQNVPIRVLSGPISNRNPEPSSLIAVIVGGFILGFLISLSVVFLRNEAGRREPDFSLR